MFDKVNMSSYFGKVLVGFCSTMSVYGFTRGYRAQEGKIIKESLTSDKIANATINSLFYAMPIMNIGPTLRLINRLEIEHKRLHKDDYKDNYREFVGECMDTI
jgi:hypothetical protein